MGICSEATNGYKHHYQFKNVRPKKVLDAARYLVDTSELFRVE